MASDSINSPELFGKDEKLDKLIIKNQIAYHFKKVVREVSQELFVSRRIDVSLLFAGIQVLRKTESEVRKVCDELPRKRIFDATPAPEIKHTVETKVIHLDSNGKNLQTEQFLALKLPVYASFKEAKARCLALGMQLPEIYTADQIKALSDFLQENKITHCFAGIEPDLSDAIQRHIMTQYPIWKTPYKVLHECTMTGKPLIQTELLYSLDDGNAKFLYTGDGRLCVTHDSTDNPFFHKSYVFMEFRERHKTFSQTLSKVVCSRKWDGLTNIDLPNGPIPRGGVEVGSKTFRKRREIRINKLRLRRQASNVNTDMANVQSFCYGVADQAKESS